MPQPLLLLKKGFYMSHVSALPKLFSITLLASSLVLTGCNDDNDDSYTNVSSSLVTKTENYAPQQTTATTTVSDKITYKMPSINGDQTSATAVVMIPKGTMPANGWPVVVWAHGTTGVADQCAPSNLKDNNDQFTLGSALPLVQQLVSQGYAVIAPDYEGLGSPGIHPFLNAKSESESIISALKASKQQYKNQLSNDWVVVGHSQGGHAAIAAAEHANEAGLNFKGAVAYAPASHLKETFDLGQRYAQSYLQAGDYTTAVGILTGLETFSSLITAGIKQTSANFKYTDVFAARSASIAQRAETELCSTQLGQSFAADIQAYLQTGRFDYPGLLNNFADVSEIKTFLAASTIGKTKINQPLLIVQGTADTTVPAQATQLLEKEIKDNGTQVEVDYVPNENHSSIIFRTNYLSAFLAKNLPSREQM